MLDTYESDEYPGYVITKHPMPEGYEPRDWFHMCKCMHTARGRIVKHVQAYSVGGYRRPEMMAEPYQEEYGVEVVWTVT